MRIFYLRPLKRPLRRLEPLALKGVCLPSSLLPFAAAFFFLFDDNPYLHHAPAVYSRFPSTIFSLLICMTARVWSHWVHNRSFGPSSLILYVTPFARVHRLSDRQASIFTTLGSRRKRTHRFFSSSPPMVWQRRSEKTVLTTPAWSWAFPIGYVQLLSNLLDKTPFICFHQFISKPPSPGPCRFF